MIAMEVLAWLIAVLPSTALVIFSLEVLFGLAPSKKTEGSGPQGRMVTILVPAHDEEAGIGATVEALQAIAPAGVSILVVADNCTDKTAAKAAKAGADVVERFDSQRRGKGYALDFGRNVLLTNLPDVVIVVDADCRLEAGSIERLCDAVASGSTAQAVNLIIPDLSAAALVQISSFAMLVKNLVRSRGLGRIGGGALLTGTGMAFPGSVFASAPLATGDIAEDLRLGIALTRAGIRTRLVTDAHVRSRAASLRDSVAQRRRWEHGFLANAVRHSLPTLLAGLATGSRALVGLGLHLLVPPLALLFLIAGLALALLAAIGTLWHFWMPAVALGASLSFSVLLTGIAWFLYGRTTLRLTALLQAPLYIAWKVPTYVRFLFARENRWQRARRDGDRE